MEVYYVEQQKATVLEKEFIYSTCWLIGMELRPNVNTSSSLSRSLSLCISRSFHHFTSVLAQDPGGLPNGPRVWHRRRTLTSCRTPCRASCRQEWFPPQVTHAGVLGFSQRPAAHPLNGTSRNPTVHQPYRWPPPSPPSAATSPE